MNPRQQAHDAAGWYFSHIDPYSTNQENIRNYLRRPLLAVTANTLLSDDATKNYIQLKDDTPPAPLLALASGNDKEEEEEKKSPSGDSNGATENGGAAWKDYLQKPASTASETSINNNKTLQEAYEGLTRRTKARMEAFLAGCTLAVPSTTGNSEANTTATSSESSTGSSFSLGVSDGLTGFHHSFGDHSSSKNSKNNNNTSMNTSSSPNVNKSERFSFSEQGNKFIRQISHQPTHQMKHPQIEESDLLLRLELYIRTLQRVKTLSEECVIAMEPPKVIKLRATYLTQDFVATAGCVRDLSPVLTRLLNCVTMELLAVECLPDKISKAVKRISMKYEHETSFASFAFLSTPEVNASSQLTPLIVKYLKFLQSDWENLISDAKLEFMLSHGLDSNMRRVFKTIEFQSIGHLLEVCHEFRNKLHNIELAPNVCAVTENFMTLCNSKEAVRQALRDLQREVITVNGHVLPPVTSRKDLLHLLKQTLNSRSLTAPPKPREKRNHKGKGNNHKTKNNNKEHTKPVSRSTSCPELIEAVSQFDDNHDDSKEEVIVNEDSDAIFSSTDWDSSEVDPQGDDDDDDILRTPTKKTPKKKKGSTSPPTSPSGGDGEKKARQRRSFHLSTIDLLTRRLLIAASRTGNGGDAYFIVYVYAYCLVIL